MPSGSGNKRASGRNAGRSKNASTAPARPPDEEGLANIVPQRAAQRKGQKSGRAGTNASKRTRQGKPAETVEQKRKREEQELAIERERAWAADEDDRARALRRSVSAFTATHAAAGTVLLKAYDSASRVGALRSSVSPAEVSKVRSPAVRKTLKADMKKGTGLSKRVQGMTEETAGLVIKDIATYALGRYAGEIALAMGSDSTLRPNELEHALSVAVAMHARYPDFAPVLLSTLLLTAIRAVDVASVGDDGKKPTALHAPLRALHAALTKAKQRVAVPSGEFGAAEGDAGGVPETAIKTAAIASVEAKDPKGAASRLRTLLRFLLDLACAGVYSDSEGVLGVLLGLLADAAVEAGTIARSAASSGAPAPAAPGPSTLSFSVTSGVNPFSSPACPVFKTSLPLDGKVALPTAVPPKQEEAEGKPLSPSIPAPSVSEEVASRAVAVLPLVTSLLKFHGEDSCGRPSRKTRAWLASSPAFGPHGELLVDPLAAWAAAAPRNVEDEPEWMRDAARASGVGGEGSGAAPVPAAPGTTPGEPKGAEGWPYAKAWLSAFSGARAPPSGLSIPLGGPAHAFAVMTQGGKDAEGGLLHTAWMQSHPAVRPHPTVPGTVSLHLPCLFLSPDQQFVLLRACDRYFDAVSTSLLTDVRGVLELEARARAAQFARGGLSEVIETQLATRRANLERLLEGTRALAECLDRELPPLPTEVTLEDDEDESGGGKLRVVTGFNMAGHGPFDDPAEASFYRGFPTLEAAPRVLLDPEGLYTSGLVAPAGGAEASGGAKPAVGTAPAASAATSSAAGLPGSSAGGSAPTAPPGSPSVVVVSVVKEANPRDRIKGTLDSALGQLSSIPVGTKVVKVQGPTSDAGGADESGSDEEGGEGVGGGGSRGEGGPGMVGGDPTHALNLGEYKSSHELKELLSGAGMEEFAASGGTAGMAASSSSSSSGRGAGGSSDTDAVGDSVTFASLLERLQRLGSADDADRWAHDFIFGQLNSRTTRVRLLKALFTGTRTADGGGMKAMVTDSLPFIARLVAELDSGLPEPARLAPPLSVLLEEEFKGAMRKWAGRTRAGGASAGADRVTSGGMPSASDVRYRAVRLMAELVKFGALDPKPLFRCAKLCLNDATLANLSLLGVLIDTAGRHLFLRPDTNETVVRMTEALKRVKEGTQITGQQAVKQLAKAAVGKPAPAPSAAPAPGAAGRALAGPAVDLIDGMLFTIQPPEKPAATVKLRTPMVAFIRYIMLEKRVTSDDDVDELLKLLRKLPWSAAADHTLTRPSGATFEASGDIVERAIVKAILAASRLDGSRIEMLMSALAGLKAYHDRVAVRVVDAAINRILTAVEEPVVRGGGGAVSATLLPARARQPSRVLGAVRILGHAYNYKLCDGPTLIRVLYMVINAGHALPRAQLDEVIKSANEQLMLRAVARRTLPEDASAVGRKEGKPPTEEDDEEEETFDALVTRQMTVANDDAMDRILVSAEMEVARARAAGVEEAVLATLTPRIVAPPSDPASGGCGFHPCVFTPADPPGDTLRSRIVAAMLEVSGEFFCKGAGASRMDKFLTYFLRYVANRAGPGSVGVGLPMDTVFAVTDALEAIRPKLRMPGSAGTSATSKITAEIDAAKLELEELSRAAIDDLEERVEAAIQAGRSSRAGAGGSLPAPPAPPATRHASDRSDEEEEDEEEEEEEEEDGEDGEGEDGEEASVGEGEGGGAEGGGGSSDSDSDSEGGVGEPDEGEEGEEGQVAPAPAPAPDAADTQGAKGGDAAGDSDSDADFESTFRSFVREQADAARRNAQGGQFQMRLGAAPVTKHTAGGAGQQSNVEAGTVQFAVLSRKAGGGGSRSATSATLAVPTSEGWVQQTAAAAAAEAALRDEHKRATLRLVQDQVDAEDRATRMAQRTWTR